MLLNELLSFRDFADSYVVDVEGHGGREDPSAAAFSRCSATGLQRTPIVAVFLKLLWLLCADCSESISPLPTPYMLLYLLGGNRVALTWRVARNRLANAIWR